MQCTYHEFHCTPHDTPISFSHTVTNIQLCFSSNYLKTYKQLFHLIMKCEQINPNLLKALPNVVKLYKLIKIKILQITYTTCCQQKSVDANRGLLHQ